MRLVRGPKIQPFLRPLGAQFLMGLVGVLSLLLVPLLYVLIFRARRKHANAAGEWHRDSFGRLLIIWVFRRGTSTTSKNQEQFFQNSRFFGTDIFLVPYRYRYRVVD